MKRCVIHFGMFKTGSSSIQHSFAEQLGDQHWHYLKLGSPNHGGAFSRLFAEDLSARRHVIFESDLQGLEAKKLKLKKRLAKQLSGTAENFLASAEWFSSNAFKPAHVAQLQHLFLDYVDQVEAVGYIRSPKAYMESAFQETLKHGAKGQLNFAKLYPRYRERIEKFDQVLGKDKVRVWKFDPSTFYNGCVVQEFCRQLQIDFPVADIKRINESLSYEATAFLYTYRAYGPGFGEGIAAIAENKLLIARLAQLKGRKLRFSWSAVSPVLEANRDDIHWIEERVGVSLDENEPESPDAVKSPEDLLRYSPESLVWLAEQLGDASLVSDGVRITPKKVAVWLHKLRLKLAQEAGLAVMAADGKRSRLTVSTLAGLVKQASPTLQNLSDADTDLLLSEAFKHIIGRVGTDNNVLVEGLGVFKTSEKGDKKTAKKITFHIKKT